MAKAHRNARSYRYVAAWGRMLHSFEPYVKDQQEQAEEDGAPLNATHRKQDGTWSTTGDIKDPATAAIVESYAREALRISNTISGYVR
jgi:hypothetical protein